MGGDGKGDARGDGFMDKAGEASRTLFAGGGKERRYRDGAYESGPASNESRRYASGTEDAVPMTGSGAEPHYGAKGGGPAGGTARTMDRGLHGDDPHYHAARAAHLESFDRDYEEYRRENGSPDGDFGTWHTARQGQRAAIVQVTEHMEVVGNDGIHVGTVDAVRGERIILTRNDTAAGGAPHSIPLSWIQGVGAKVMLNRPGEEARKAWNDARDDNRALGERADQGSDGPHILERSFSGTYDKQS